MDTISSFINIGIHRCNRVLGCALLALLLHGCAPFGAGVKDQPDSEATTLPDAETQPETETAELPPKPFSEDTLLNLLVGELAVYDRDIATAANNYQREARITRDVAVTERAARLTRYLRDAEAALEMAQLWYELAPDNANAAHNLADLYARSNQPLQALSVLEAQTARGQSAKFGILRNSKFTSDSELNAVIQRLDKLDQSTDHDNFSLIFTHTLLLQKSGQTEAALKQLHELDRFESDPIQLALIESQLLSELERHREAAQVLAKALKRHPDEKRLAITHARKLTKVDLPRAKAAFEALLQNDPDDKNLLMSHALVAAELEEYEAADDSLQKLLAQGVEKSFAHYNLGLIAEQRDQQDQALGHFEKVKQGKHFLPAAQKIIDILQSRQQLVEARDFLSSLRARQPVLAPTFWSYEAKLLADEQRIEEAHRVLSSAIMQFPEQHQLRMQRSFLSEKLDQLELVETDLRYVLARDPNNADALNALGYILADRTQRYVEARALIEKAFALMPESAAIMDSMGWVMYKQGEYENAIEYLEKAFEKMADDEVAAHLIEIYWKLGDRSSAKKIHKKIRRATDQQPKVDAVLERMDIRF